MKVKYTIFFLVSFVFNSFIFSQISITKDDFYALVTAGNTFHNYADTSSVTVDIGQPGGNNNWDFSIYNSDFSFDIQYMLPSETPYADSFATANIVSYFTFSQTQDDGSTTVSESWAYHNKNDASLLGNISNISNSYLGETHNSLTVVRHLPPFIEYIFPLEYSNTWSVIDTTETLSISDGVAIPKSTSTSQYDFNIDAWGTMKLPGGTSVEALRIREVETSATYILGIPIGTEVTVSYIFLTKDGRKSFSVTAESDNPPTSGTITGLVGWSNNDVTDVNEVSLIPDKFELKQNYPNPFNPSTTIEYSINTPGFVSLKLYDILGNEIKTLVSKEQTAGIYRFELDGSHLSSGNYFLRLVSGNKINTKKIVLLK